MTKFDLFLFYDDGSEASRDLRDTIDAAKGKGIMPETLTRRLVTFASEYALSGNIWQQWLTYLLMTLENPFTLACEREAVREDSTLFRLALPDFGNFRALFRLDFRETPEARILYAMTDWKPPYEQDRSSGTGEKIARLSHELARTEDSEAFGRVITAYYRTYGAGIYSLYRAFRVSGDGKEIRLVPVTEDTDVCFDDLIGLEEQKKTLKENTEAFLNAKLANNVLLYGDSGTGKSTSIHALMHDYFDQGLRLVEISKQDRRLLPGVLAAIKKRNYRFIIFLDDLSFEENESDYKELKAMLEGALEKRSDRVLIYATSNRRHLIRETWKDRNDMEYQEDIHHSDTMEEKLSLASRFGVTIYYSKPDPKEYLRIVRELCARSGVEISEKDLFDAARKWELRHGGMSGRTASQFITWLKGTADEKQ